jgi:hypothetical protein
MYVHTILVHHRSKLGPEEKLALAQLHATQVDLACTEGMYINDIHVGPYLDAISESKAMHACLKSLIEATKRDADNARYIRDLENDRYHTLQEDNVTFRLRESIAYIRSVLFKLRRRKRLEHLESGTDQIELEILRWNLNKERLEASRGTSFEPTV